MYLEPGFWGRGRKDSEVFGWSRIPKNSRSRIVYPTLEVQFNHCSHHTPRLGVVTRACRNGAISFVEAENFAVYHAFHSLLVATKLLTAKLHSCYAKESWVGNFGKVGVGHFNSDCATVLDLLNASHSCIFKHCCTRDCPKIPCCPQTFHWFDCLIWRHQRKTERHV